jgi:hypothetical protein
MRPLRALMLTLIGFVACLAAVGCEGRESDLAAGAESDAPPRWVHRYVPKGVEHYRPEDDRWLPESEVPRGPVTEKGMVIWEVSEHAPGSAPTADQQAAADDLVERCYAAALRHRWHEYDRGINDGYRRIDAYHYRNNEFMLDDHVLDPDRPEVLMYYPTPPDAQERLAGVMFYARSREARGPQIGGPLTVWHFHSWLRSQCVVDGLSVNWSVGGECQRGVPSQYSGEMMHVWLVDHPEGVFASPMYLPTDLLMRGLERRLEERGF